MLFEDLTEDVRGDEATKASPPDRLPLLDAYWQDLLTNRQEVEPAAPERRVAPAREVPLPAADRELMAVR